MFVRECAKFSQYIRKEATDMANRLTKEQLNYYEQGLDDVKFSAEDDKQVDIERQERIGIIAQDDVSNRRKKRSASSFNNNAEYKLYLLSVYEAAYRDYKGVK